MYCFIGRQAVNQPKYNVPHFTLFKGVIFFIPSKYKLDMSRYFIEAEWRIYASVTYAIIGSDNGLSPGRCQAIIWISVRILLIGPLRTSFNEILIEIHAFSFSKLTQRWILDAELPVKKRQNNWLWVLFASFKAQQSILLRKGWSEHLLKKANISRWYIPCLR